MRRIAGVKRIDIQKIEELREEVGVRESFTKKLVGRVEGRRRRGRPRLGCEDCVKRDQFGVSWRGVGNESEGWGSGE